jgi:hypothetical protein
MQQALVNKRTTAGKPTKNAGIGLFCKLSPDLSTEIVENFSS